MKKLMSTMLAALMMAMLLAGCGSSAGGEDDSSQKGGSKDGYVIGYSDWGLVNTWRVQMQAEFDQTAEPYLKDGTIKQVIHCNADNDVTKQIQDIRDLISKKVDLILVSCIDEESLNSVIAEAMDAGIPVIAFAQLTSTDHITSQVGYDDYTYGKIGGEWLREALDGKGDIIVLGMTAGTSTDENRMAGFQDAVKGSDIKVLGQDYGDGDYGKSKTVIASLLSAYPNIDGVYSMCGQTTQALVDYCNEEGLPLYPAPGEAANGFLRVWKDNMNHGFESIAPAAPTSCGTKALEVGLKVLAGEEVDEYYDVDMPIITADNIDDYFEPDLADSYWATGTCDYDLAVKTFGLYEK